MSIDRDSSLVDRILGCAGAALLALAAFVFASAPIAVGMVAADLLPGDGGLKAGIPLPALILAPVGPVIVMIALAPRIERVVERFGLRGRAGRVVSGLGCLLLLSVCLRLFMTDFFSALVAAVIATVGYKLAEPLIVRLPG